MTSDPEFLAASAKSLQHCPGWVNWMLPLIEERKALISKLLLDELSEEETKTLRMEHRLLTEWAARPEQTLANLRTKSQGASGNGAV